jgi:hypothetical protein
MYGEWKDGIHFPDSWKYAWNKHFKIIMYMYRVSEVSICPLSMIFLLNFGTVATEWYINYFFITNKM